MVRLRRDFPALLSRLDRTRAWVERPDLRAAPPPGLAANGPAPAHVRVCEVAESRPLTGTEPWPAAARGRCDGGDELADACPSRLLRPKSLSAY
jgi:hypothetical protein